MSFTYVEGSATPNLAGLVDVGTLDGTGATGIRLSGGGGGTFELLGAPGLFWGSAALRDGVTPLSNDHGGFAGTPLYLPREFSLVGEISVPVLADLWGAIDLLFKTFNLASTALKTHTLNTTGWSATRQIAARIAGDIRITEPADKNGHLATRRGFTVPGVAPDPRIYSTTEHNQTITSNTSVTNAGDQLTPFKVRFNGPQTNPKLDLHGTSGTKRIKFTGTITTGNYVEVNTYNNGVMTAVDNSGANAYGTGTYGTGVTKATAFVLATGASAWDATNDSGAGSTVLYWRDAW